MRANILKSHITCFDPRNTGNQVVVQFDQPISNGSEGNVAVVCVSALFPPSEGRFDTNQELFTVDLSVVGQGSAGMCTHDR